MTAEAEENDIIVIPDDTIKYNVTSKNNQERQRPLTKLFKNGGDPYYLVYSTKVPGKSEKS